MSANLQVRDAERYSGFDSQGTGDATVIERKDSKISPLFNDKKLPPEWSGSRKAKTLLELASDVAVSSTDSATDGHRLSSLTAAASAQPSINSGGEASYPLKATLPPQRLVFKESHATISSALADVASHVSGLNYSVQRPFHMVSSSSAPVAYSQVLRQPSAVPLKRKELSSPPTMSRPLKLAIFDFSEYLIRKLFMSDTCSGSHSYALGVDLVSPNGVDITPLPRFVHYSISRTKLCPATVLVALIYLQRLKLRYPACHGSNGAMHRLALASLLLASKYLYDDSYDNRAWTTVSCGLYSMKEVNCMERELLGFLDYNLSVSESDWVSVVQLLLHYMNSVSWKHQQQWGIVSIEMYYEQRQEFMSHFFRWSMLDQCGLN